MSSGPERQIKHKYKHLLLLIKKTKKKMKKYTPSMFDSTAMGTVVQGSTVS